MSFTSKTRSFFKLVRKGKPRKAVLATYVELVRKFYDVRPTRGIRVVDEEWDVLVVLDACRYDYFEELHDFEGTLQKRRSRGSSTSEWLEENFTDYYDDIVYVSANPRISDTEVDGFRGTDHFHEVRNVWKSNWDPDLNTVKPADVTDAAIRLRAEYPDKRLVVHYIQPHAPWIGETRLSDRDTTIEDPTPSEWIETGKTWGTMLNEGKPEATVRQAYEDNLGLVLEEVKRLVDSLGGRIVVTSDHGECFGEKFFIEHPRGIHVDELVAVPWHVIEKPKRNAESAGEASAASSERAAIRNAVKQLPKGKLG